MKKFLNLAFLAVCFVALSASTAIAQNDYIKNGTNCKIIVKVAYGPIGAGCTTTGSMSMISYPGTSVSMGIPAGTEIKAAKGTYISPPANCPFYTGLPCSGYPLSGWVSCATSCGDYKFKYYVGTGIKIWN